MITKYDEFLNESFYDWMSKKTTDNQEVIDTIMAIVTFITVAITGFNDRSLFDPTGIKAIDQFNIPYLYFMAFLNLPMTIHIFRRFTRDMYDSFRSGTMKFFANKKIEEVEAIMEEFPEIEQQLVSIKRQLRIAIMNKDKKKISRCIHEIYVVAKNLKNKKKYKAIFGFTEKEKEYEKGLKKIDPLGEEDWSN